LFYLKKARGFSRGPFLFAGGAPHQRHRGLDGDRQGSYKVNPERFVRNGMWGYIVSSKPIRGLVFLFIAVLVCGLAAATDVEKKWRISLASGGFNTTDNVPSQSGNSLTILDEFSAPIDIIRDPRSDSAVFGKMGMNSSLRTSFSAQYAFHRFFLVEASVGYQVMDVGDVEIQAQFPGQRVPTEKEFDFQFYRVPVGEMEQIPFTVSMMARFRPRANFNPYFGIGAGYTVVGFEPDAALNELSLNIENSTGGFIPFGSTRGSSGFASPASVSRLRGATVDARDTFTWHFSGGAELDIKKKWSAFVDMRWIFASRDFTLSFDGKKDGLGLAVPNGVLFEDSVEFRDLLVSQGMGAYLIQAGGIVDGGRSAPIAGAPINTDCSLIENNSLCEFIFEPDGELDVGVYYVQGGEVNYGGISLQLGLRYTF
jgi:outer membrane protein W